MPLKVLVIDDFIPAAEMLSLLMEMWGHEVKHTSKATEVFTLIKDFVPDIVLCDINMPDIQGNELCIQMRKDTRLKNTLFIAQTGISPTQGGKMIREAGFHYHLLKPIDPGILGNIINTHIQARALELH